jgi:hypothetical protein
MSRNVPNPKIRELAQRLLTDEVARDRGAEATMPALALVAEKLRRPLVTLTGIAGFRSLLARALTLAKAQAPALNMVQVEPDSSLTGFADDDAQVAEAGVMLIAELLDLLVIFIGERLMLTLVRDAWPDLLFLDDGTLEKN